MPWYAAFDYTLPSPAPVIGWYDTSYPVDNLPDFRSLLALTEDQWNGRLPDPNNWAVSDGALVPYTPQVPLPLQAQAMLASYIARGITVTSASLPAINATYALDSVSTGQIFQIGTFAKSFGMFANGTNSQPYPDINSTIYVFTVPVFIAFLLAVASLISALQVAAGTMSQGGSPTWPTMSASIT